jgi:SNF2 family DNA or RNA helicase
VQVVIVQYEMVMSKPDFGMLKNLAWSYMVVDEGHRLKNKDSKLFNVLSKDYSSRRKLILTGYPLNAKP